MADIEETEPDRSRKKTRKRVRSEESTLNADPSPSKPSPTDRLESAKDKHIELLHEERRRLLKKVDQLNQLGPENARLKEALGNAMANNILATILVTIGGGSISLAPFTEGLSKLVASGGVALLLSGVLILIVSAVRSRVARSPPPS